MPVFISHKREDTREALLLHHYMQRFGVISYVDVLDPSIQTADDLTALLMRRVRDCTHLMAVVSDHTERSWWVPFEIGVASELARRIATYRASNIELPDYLSKWPILTGYSDVDTFIHYYKKDSAVNIGSYRSHHDLISDANEFHLVVKRALRQ